MKIVLKPQHDSPVVIVVIPNSKTDSHLQFHQESAL